jgi:predicted extracellular nuclease
MAKFRFGIPLFLLAVLWAPLATSVSAVSTTIVISEFRTRGPAGGNDEFIELHNVSDGAIDISGWKIRGSNAGGTVGNRVIINAGTTLGPGCFFLATNNAASGYSGAVAGNQTYNTGVTDDGGIAVTLPNDTVVDAVGMSAGSAFKEGTTLSPTTVNAERGIERKPGGVAGHDVDTDNNVNDFQANTAGNPQNLASPCIDYGDGASISIDDVAVTEGDSGQMLATFTVTATGVHSGITFDIAAVDGTGGNAATVANNDFDATSAVGSIAAGETAFSFSVTVNGDTTFEPSETYSVVISNVNGASAAKGTGIGTIVNDDPAPPVVSDVVISQVYGGGGNAGATLTNDFIELFNRSTATIDLTGWSVQYVSATGSGTWQVTPLSGTIAPGRYYLVQQAAGAGGTTPLPTADATGSIAMGAGSGKVALQMNAAPITGACPLANTADLVGYGGTATCSETTPIDPATSNTTAALRKRSGCFDSNNNDVDFSIALPAPRNSSSPANSCSVTTLTISQIQGNSFVTPYAGQFVATSGIVTAIKSNGFFLQEPGLGDSDAATSDAVFVFTQVTPAVAPGNAVNVQGTASEFFQLTQVEASLPGDVAVQSAGHALPDAITLTTSILDPDGTPDQLEQFEAMRVFASSLTSVAPTNEFGEIDAVLTGVPRPMRETGISVLDPVPVDPSSGAVDCCIPRFDENPERIMVDTDALGLAPLAVTSHVMLADVGGPLDFAFGRYKIAVETTPAASANISGVPVPAAAANEFTVGGYNIENFTGGEPQLTKASLAIRQLMRSPDVIGHIEILDQPTLQTLANKVNADSVAAGLGDPQYQAILIPFDPPGGTANTQNVGFLVKTSRVRIDAYTQELADETFVDPGDGSVDALHDRPPLVLRATFDYNGPNPTPGIVVINHLRSFIDIELLTGAGPRVRAKRTAQAESVARLLQQLQTDNPGVPVISLGDYNAFQFNDGYTDPIAVLKGQPTPDDEVVVDASPDLVDPNYVNLTDSLPASERYSFIFEGTPQALDHVLVNTAAAQLVQRYAIARGNSDFPEVPAALYAADTTRPERSSDHDMPVAYFLLPDVTAPVITGVPADITRVAEGPGGAVVTFTLPTAEDNTDGALPVTCIPASGSLFPIGTTQVTCTATDASGNSTTATFNVTVTDPRTPGAMSGAGTAGAGANSVTFEFEVRESGAERGHIVATVRQGGQPRQLISLGVDSVFFTNDGSSTPGRQPASGIDSVVFSGPASFDGSAGYTYEVRATDRGEPGRNDTFTLIVRNAAGVEIVNAGGTLAAGNIQSRKAH